MRLIDVLAGFDQRVILALNILGQRKKMKFIMRKLTRIGGTTVTVGVVLASIGLGSHEWKRAGYYAALSLAITTLVVQILKKWTKRFRPYLKSSKVTLIGKPEKDHSFPSGHTAAVFSIVMAFSLFFPYYSIPLFIIASLVGLSRIFLGFHYPSDVLAGATLGIVISLFTHTIVSNWWQL